MGNQPESVKVGTDMITSTSNAQIKKIIQLNTKGKARRNSRAFVVEGVKMFLEAPLDWIEEVYLAESFLEKYQGSKKEEYKQELLEKLETTGYETVSDQVFRHAADTMTPQGKRGYKREFYASKKNRSTGERICQVALIKRKHRCCS